MLAAKDDMTRFLVTGANGFVGRALCQYLLDRGCRVRGAVRTSSIDILPREVEQVVIADIGRQTDWSAALEQVDVVIHLAARVHMMQDLAQDPMAEFMEVNAYGTENLARQSAAKGVKRFVYVSSIKVNGESTMAGQSMSELDIPQPQDPYSVSKWRAEQALHDLSPESSMGVTIIRPPLVYGPGVKANFARLIEVVGKGVPLPLKNIRNSRSLIYVGNLVDALYVCATNGHAAGRTYLVADGAGVSTPALVGLIAEALGKPDRVFGFPVGLMKLAARLMGKAGAMDRLTQSLEVDNSRICSQLSWRPPYTLAQGLQETADWYKKNKFPAKR